MTAPIWMAFPPEVHSASLSSGAGPGPLLTAAEAWNSLSAEYADVAAELRAVLASVRAGAWAGPSAEQYAAANTPYLVWLMQASVDSSAAATQHQTAAAAYTGALAAMPTLAELGANHATHAVLIATNFFGINAIPIALNEADYARMWTQAATVMSTYQTVSSSAVAGVPTMSPAPRIVKAGATAHPGASNSSGLPPSLSDLINEIQQFFANFLEPSPNTQGLPPGIFNIINQLDGVFNSFLPPQDVSVIGNPLLLFTPQAIEGLFQYATTLPLPNGVTGPLSLILSDITGELPVYTQLLPSLLSTAGGNPAAIAAIFLYLQAGVVADLIYYVIQFAHFFPVYFAVIAALPLTPLLTAPLGAVGGFAGLAGLAGLMPTAGIPAPPLAPMPAITPVLSLAPIPAGAPAAPAPTATAPGAVPASPAPSTPPPPVAGPGGFPYLAGGLTSSTRASAQARTHEPTSRSAAAAPELPAAAPTVEHIARRRRRRTKATMLGRGHEYMDLEDNAPPSAHVASDRGAGTHGFTGAATAMPAPTAAGLTTLAGDEYGGGPTVPMMPSSWAHDSARDRTGSEDR